MTDDRSNGNSAMVPGAAMEQEQKALEKKQRRQFSYIGFIGTAFMLLTFAAQFTLIAVVEVVNRLTGGEIDFYSTTGIMLMSAVPMYLVAFPISVALFHLVPKCGGPQRQRWGIGAFTTCFVISMGIGLAGNIIGQIIEYFKPVVESGAADMDELLMNSSMWMNLLVTVILAPVVEELFFRKFIMDRLLGFGDMAAILVSGLMFGLAHGNFSQFFYAFGIGLLWAYVYAKTGKVAYTIAFHMIFNLIGGVITIELAKGVSGLLDGPWQIRFLEQIFQVDLTWMVSVFSALLTLAYLMLLLGCLIGAITLLIVFRKQIFLSRGQWPLAKRKAFQTMALNAGMILYILVCVGLFVMDWL